MVRQIIGLRSQGAPILLAYEKESRPPRADHVSKRVRHPVSGTEQAPVGSVLRVRTKLRTSPSDEAVLSALGAHFSSLQGKDLVLRCSAGTGHDKQAWARRKQALTSECSSRWAGWATKSSNDAYALARSVRVAGRLRPPRR